MYFSIEHFYSCFSALLLKLITKRISIANVVVRIPPPTELGDEPINMRILIITFVASLKFVTSMVCNDYVLLQIEIMNKIRIDANLIL